MTGASGSRSPADGTPAPGPLLPVNLTVRAEDLRRTGSTEPARHVLTRPALRCDQLSADALRAETETTAARDEVYVVLAGFGSMRCADGSLMELTAGDVVYVGAGTERRFEHLSRKFYALRLFLSPADGIPAES